MRSFFRRPPWANRGSGDSPHDFYRRSGQTYADIIAASKEAREKSIPETTSDNPADNREARKCRRISSQAGDSTATNVVNWEREQSTDMIKDSIPSTTEPGKSQENGPHKPRQNWSATVDDNNVGQSYSIVARETGKTSEIQSDECDIQTVYDEETSNISEGGSVSESTRNFEENAEDAPTCSRATTQDNAVVQILITSEIENTKPLIVQRKLSQSLRDVRLAWCERQGFTKEMQSSVFLTWKGRRLFDVTTCKSLGINTLENEIYRPLDGETVRVHMNAVTEDFLAARWHQKKPPADSKIGRRFSHEYPATEDHEQDTPIQVILKCPGLDDFSTKVGQRTRISHITAAFKVAQRVAAEKNVYLVFDGDRLNPDSCLVDYDIADLDLVDVVVK